MKTAHQITHEIESAIGEGDFSGKQCNRVTKIVEQAIAAARAAGFAEAIEMAERIARSYAIGGSGTAVDIAEDIAKIAPAATKE